MSRYLTVCLVCGLLLNSVGCSPTKSESKPPLQTLSLYASPKSDTLISLRPSEIVNSSLFEQFAGPEFAKLLTGASAAPTNIQQIAILLPSPSPSSMTSLAQIANQLKPSKTLDIRQISQSGIFGRQNPLKGMATLIRFESATPIEKVRAIVEQTIASAAIYANANDIALPEYRIVQLRDKRFLTANDDQFPAILEVDDQSFVVCPLDQMREGWEREVSGNRWARSLSDKELAADFVIVSRVKRHMQQSNPFPAIGNAKQVLLTLDLDDRCLIQSQMKFDTATNARASAIQIKRLHDTGKRFMTKNSIMASGRMGSEWQIAKQLIAVYNSIDISTKGSTLSVSIPRPKNFEQLVVSMSNLNRHQTRTVSRFGHN